MYAPDDIEQRIGLTDGNIHQVNHSAENLLGGRLFPGGGYRTPVRNLYMCGAGTHPGGEVTGAPGHNAAQAILKGLPSGPGGAV
jgi:phytoene dehydrogenase-like protein